MRNGQTRVCLEEECWKVKTKQNKKLVPLRIRKVMETTRNTYLYFETCVCWQGMGVWRKCGIYSPSSNILKTAIWNGHRILLFPLKGVKIRKCMFWLKGLSKCERVCMRYCAPFPKFCLAEKNREKRAVLHWIGGSGKMISDSKILWFLLDKQFLFDTRKKN